MKTEQPPKATPFIKGDTTRRTSTARFKPRRTATAKAHMNAAIQRHFAERSNGKPVRKRMTAFWQRQQASNAEYIRELKPEPKPGPDRNGETPEELAKLLECTRTFEQWLAVLDNSSGKREIRRIAFAQTRVLAKTPVELLELYFRAATGNEEAAIVRKIRRLKTSPSAWLSFLLRTEPSELSAFVVKRRVDRELLLKWYAEALDGDKVTLAEHLGLPKQIFGKVVLGRPKAS